MSHCLIAIPTALLMMGALPSSPPRVGPELLPPGQGTGIRATDEGQTVGPAPSYRRFWERISDYEGEPAARVAVLASRLMSRIRAARREPETQTRLLTAVVAIAQIAKIDPANGRELGFYVGRALVALEHPGDVEAERWLAAALRASPQSSLALGAWLDLARLAAKQGRTSDEFEALERASALVGSAADATAVHHDRALAFERRGLVESARREYEALIREGSDENALAQAGWHLALILDQQCDHLAALRAIDEAEARAYDRLDAGDVAIDSPEVLYASPPDRTYMEGLKHWWLSLRREQPPRRQSLQRALDAFELCASAPVPAKQVALDWHLVNLRRALGMTAPRKP